jgi:hypothetical protein
MPRCQYVHITMHQLYNKPVLLELVTLGPLHNDVSCLYFQVIDVMALHLPAEKFIPLLASYLIEYSTVILLVEGTC